MQNSEEPDQLASVKPADLDLHCMQNQIYPALALVRNNEYASILSTNDMKRNGPMCSYLVDFI